MLNIVSWWQEKMKNRKLLRYWKKNRPVGFFQIPGEKDLWSASILVKQGMDKGWVEMGPMWYIAGEAIHAWNGRLVGEYYPYSINGVHDHEHSFEEVLNTAIWSDDPLIPEEQEKYYAPRMLELLEKINRSAMLRQDLSLCGGDVDEMSAVLEDWCPQIEYPFAYVSSTETMKLLSDIEQVYQLAAKYPQEFKIRDEHLELYSAHQMENLNLIRAYQLAALRGDAP